MEGISYHCPSLFCFALYTCEYNQRNNVCQYLYNRFCVVSAFCTNLGVLYLYNLSLPEIAERIKTNAKEKGFSIKQLQLEIGVGPNYIYQMQNGREPSISVVAKIADVLGCSINYLLGIEEERNNVYFSKKEQELIETFRKMSYDDQLIEWGRIQLLAEQAADEACSKHAEEAM